MNICICGPLNPYELSEFFPKETNLPIINKAASAVNTFAKELLRKGHNVTVITSDVPLDIENDIIIKGTNIEIRIINSKPGIFLYHGLSRIYMVRRIKKHITQVVGNVDVIHAQWTYDYALATKSFCNEIPVFCTVRDWCPYILSIQKGLKKLQWYLYYFLFLQVMKSKKIRFIANSQYTYDLIHKAYPLKNIPIICNPIDKNYILEKSYKPDEIARFVTISGIISEKRKNIITLLKAFKLFHEQMNNSELIVIGGGGEPGSQLYNDFLSRGLVNGVNFVGYKSHSALIDIIDKSNCLVHPSIEETFGNILLEGMARHKVVIGGKKSGAVPQVLGNGKYGILCDVLDENSIFEAMKLSLDNNIERSLTKEAFEYLSNNFSSDVIVDKHIALYELIIAKFHNKKRTLC